MGTPVSPVSAQPKSRRALLVGVLGGLGAWAATAVGRASPVLAEGEHIAIGREYSTATSRTRVRNQANPREVFVAESTSSGTALGGISLSGTGVRGLSVASSGVYGSSSSGIGVQAVATSGLALKARGRVRFSTSGVATIPAGSTRKTVSPSVSVSPGSFVLLTPKANIGARALWFTTNPRLDRFTIHMSAPRRSGGTRVAWLLLE
jgi:hypothetical protein